MPPKLIKILKRKDYNDRLTDWATKAIKAICSFSCTVWKAHCDHIHGTFERKTASVRRKELLGLIRNEIERSESHADHTTRQLRKNVKKSTGNAKTDALVIWLDMLRNVKGETFFRKKIDSIRKTRAQPILNFFRRLEDT